MGREALPADGDTPGTRKQAEALDESDPLRHMYDKFQLPPGRLYLDGNSLGALPRATSDRLHQVVSEEWGQDLIGSWNKHSWVEVTQRIGDKLARIIGAEEENTVVACDTTSINLFKALCSCLQLRPGRPVILSERLNFPTDLYMVEGLAGLLGKGHRLQLLEHDAAFEDAITEEVAVVMLTQVSYRTGRLLDMRSITEAAHRKGALVIWDLAHSAGALPIQLTKCQVDFAVGCGYKYLNGGPGAPGFIFVARQHQGKTRQPLTGWFGHKAPFDFAGAYTPAEDIRQYLCSTPQILSLAALEVGVDTMLEVSMRDIRTKSVQLTSLFLRLIAQECGPHTFQMQSPADPERRGSQICLGHSGAYPIMQALIKRGVVGDFRPPDTLRFGFTPLYTRFVDVWDAVQHLKQIMASDEWDCPEFWERNVVT